MSDTDTDTDIAEAAAKVVSQRAQLEPAAAELIDAASQWASEQWEDIVEKVVAASPDLVGANQARLSTLKEGLHSLQADATSLAAEHLEPWLLHLSVSDQKFLDAAGDSPQSLYSNHISLPQSTAGQRDEPLRRLAGAIGPALQEAGLLVDKSPVTADGHYRFALPNEAETVKPALADYQTALKDFVRCLRTHADLVQKKDETKATQLWCDA